MNAKLSPFVYKIKGKKNYLFFDSLRRIFFHVIPEGDPKEMEAQLLKNDLLIKTEGVIPLKFIPNIKSYKENLILRELQIRITGRCDIGCKNCGHPGECFRENKDMTKKDLKNIIKQLKHVVIESIVIVGGNPLLRMDLIEMIKKGIISSKYKVYLKDAKRFESEAKKLTDMGVSITDSVCEDFLIDEQVMDVDVFNFFYNQQFNPCWGNKIAIDLQGDLKPCLWSNESIGNVKRDNIKDLIFSGRFDCFWELSKDKFEFCKECEYRYLCPDCRVITLKETGSINAKTFYCPYSPGKGVWGERV